MKIFSFRHRTTVWNYFTLKLFYFRLELFYFTTKRPFLLRRLTWVCSEWRFLRQAACLRAFHRPRVWSLDEGPYRIVGTSSSSDRSWSRLLYCAVCSTHKTSLYCKKVETKFSHTRYRALAKERKERKSIYIAPLYSVLKALRHGSHSFTCKLHHACLSFVSVHRMAPPLNVVANIYCSSLLIYRPERMKGWVGLVGWTISDGLPM